MAPELLHFLLAVYLAYFFHLTRYNLERFILNRLAIWLMGVGPQLRRVRRMTEEGHIAKRELHTRIEKCVDSLWKLTYFIIMEGCLLAITYNEPWLRVAKENIVKGWPNHELKLSMVIYHMSQCGFYMYSIVSLIFWEKEDHFPVMLIHHICSLILVACFYITGFFRMGSIILGFLNASDTLIEAHKTFVMYSKKKHAVWILFALLLLYCRSIVRFLILPLFSIEPSSYNAVMGELEATKGFDKSVFYMFNTLFHLLVFQCYRWLFTLEPYEEPQEERGD